MTLAGRRVLEFIEVEVERGGDGVAITLKTFTSSGGMCRAVARFGIKQCEHLGFVSIGTGLRHANTFSLADGWRTVAADDAKRQVQLAKLPKPPRPARAVVHPRNRRYWRPDVIRRRWNPLRVRHGARFVQRVSQGRPPKDVPIEQPTKSEDSVLDLKTAKSLGLTIPEAFLLRANTLIE